ncbi:MAG: 23S rRNA (adenine(2030)-N(6))-methyltransferase RlmJ [Pseudomonadota bacterium]|uniref:23S rRNA (adenine(2030)-N(6))-methyltransferase RlmJ n=1 Tax=Polaromonas sp. TaxID=1869339 RepID=UPI001813567C|nr:23S rRNA (adenine(2030)-N(6))-methyltransferase RlmJ [Polaromonas sp.]MBA3595414.1 23S rRNA (adenine(2030)-N(6))-methyltransferase RlmJ [Polaromonas sp.]MDQ3272873.1 23S rRNA (adenine(2030)-N(6))-methyltransferase RlmJ [Pseudomonadota bacterium]
MFSYRHAFHAGNHADVLKHTTLIALMKYLTQKDTALTVFDTHAGAGLYRLDGDYTETSGEAKDGVFRLISVPNVPLTPAGTAQTAIKTIASRKAKPPANEALAPALQDYVDLLRSLNQAFAETGDPAQLKIYPGSPFIAQKFLSGRDKLKLFELHPTDFKSLSGNIEQLGAGRQVSVTREDGFEVLKTFLPPPARRAMVLCDPSYEIKTDYARVVACMADAVKRFATGTYVVWYPIIPRPEAHDLPRKLKTLAVKAGRSWLNATLTVKSSKLTTDESGDVKRPGLPASGMFVINPPHTLKAELQAALPQMVARLGQDRNAGFTLEHGG